MKFLASDNFALDNRCDAKTQLSIRKFTPNLNEAVNVEFFYVQSLTQQSSSGLLLALLFFFLIYTYCNSVYCGSDAVIVDCFVLRKQSTVYECFSCLR